MTVLSCEAADELGHYTNKHHEVGHVTEIYVDNKKMQLES